jgi:cytochrome c biogenesis protein
VFTPTTVLDPAEGYVSKFPAAIAPGLTITGFVGNLHLDEGVPQNVYALDVRDMKQLAIDGPAGEDRPAQVLALADPNNRTLSGLPGGYELEVDGVREFATFQTKSDPYKSLVLGAAVAVIAGLVASLRVRRRRVWVRARPGGLAGDPDGTTVVEFGGLARSNAEAFAAELDSLAGQLRAATGDHSPRPTNDPTNEQER